MNLNPLAQETNPEPSVEESSIDEASMGPAAEEPVLEEIECNHNGKEKHLKFEKKSLAGTIIMCYNKRKNK